MERLVFLDSRDLINCIEKHRPCGAPRLGRELTRDQATLALTFTNVLESLPKTSDVEYAVEFARRLQSLPHVFIPHTEVGAIEFREAVEAFGQGRSPIHRLPQFSTWAAYVSTFAPRAPDSHQAAYWDAIPLTEHVRTFFLDKQLLEFDPSHRDRIVATFAQNRSVLGKRSPSRSIMKEFIEGQLAALDLKVSSPADFASWLYDDVSICPGWRLMMEASEELRRDEATPIAQGDLPDLTHLYLVPYARAATLDAKWREYVGRAQRRLSREGIAARYPIYRDLAELRSKWRAAA